jgi:hypothetical protein
MNRFGHYAALAITCLVVPAQNIAVQEGLQVYREQGNVVLSRLVEQVKSESSDSDRKIENAVLYQVTPDPGINAFAYQVHGQRKIEITAGLIQIIDWLSISETISLVRNTPSCDTAYTQNLGNVIRDNTQLYREGLPLQLATAPYRYYAAHPDECASVTPATVDSDEKMIELRQIFQAQMLKLVLLHEIGHQVNDDPFSTVDRCQQQKREARADAYSFKGLSRPGSMPAAAIGLFTIFALTEGGSADDRWSDHPAALKRILAMLEATRQELKQDPSLMQALRSTGKGSLYFASVNEEEADIREQIAKVKKLHPESICPD